MDEIVKSAPNNYVCVKCKLKKLLDNKEEYFIMMKITIYQEILTIIKKNIS